MCTDLNNNQDLHNFGGIYFSGGDPIRLIDKVIASGFDKTLKDYYMSNEVIYGQSAGAVIFGEHILRIDKQSSQPGLHFISHYSICCHYNKSQGFSLKHLVHKTNDRVIAIRDGTALHITGTDYKVIGENPPYIFEKNTFRLMDLIRKKISGHKGDMAWTRLLDQRLKP